MGLYNEALDYYEKEYELIKDVPKEAFTTMYNIAETLFLAKKPYGQIEKACMEARRAVRSFLSFFVFKGPSNHLSTINRVLLYYSIKLVFI